MRRIILIAAVAVAVSHAAGCRCAPAESVPFPTRETLVWESVSFHVGMPKTEALKQLKDAVILEEFEPESSATIIRPPIDQLGRDTWVLGFVSLRPIGPECIARLSFTEGVLHRIEIVAEAEGVRRADKAYPETQEFIWGGTTLRVGMGKEEALRQVRLGAGGPRTGRVSVPGEEEAAADVWTLCCAGNPMVGNAARIRLTFADQVIRRIQIIAELH